MVNMLEYNLRKSDKVTVVVPVFNGQSFIINALDSLAEQTYQNLQVIIVDDGSTDGTSKLCKLWCETHAGFEYHFQANAGISAAINLGISLADGKYIARMDADDIADRTRVSKQVEYLDKNSDVDIVSSGYTPFFNEDEFLPPVIHPSNPKVIALLLCFCSPVCHPSVMARTEVFDKYRYSSSAVAEDHDLWCRLASTHKIGNISESLLFYRLHSNSLTKRKFSKIRWATLAGGFSYYLQNYNLFHDLDYKTCISQLQPCHTIRKIPAILILTLAKFSYFLTMRLHDKIV